MEVGKSEIKDVRERAFEAFKLAISPPRDFEREFREMARFVAKEIVNTWFNMPDEEKLRLLPRQLIDYLVDTYDLISCLACVVTNLERFWFNVLISIYDLTTLIEIVGFLLEGEINPNSTFEFYADLTPLETPCICPIHVCTSNLGANWGRLTILLNEVCHPKLKSDWCRKYAAVNEPISGNDVPIETAYRRFVYFPKLTVRITIYNRHPTDVMYFTWYTHFIKTNLDFAIWLTENVWEPFVQKLVRAFITPESPIVKRTELHKYLGR